MPVATIAMMKPSAAFESQREGAFDLPHGMRINVFN